MSLGFTSKNVVLKVNFVPFRASSDRAPSQSHSQRLHSFWSAPRMQDLWDNQCQNADESKSDWLLKFTGSLRVRSSKTGNENVLQ